MKAYLKHVEILYALPSSKYADAFADLQHTHRPFRSCATMQTVLVSSSSCSRWCIVLLKVVYCASGEGHHTETGLFFGATNCCHAISSFGSKLQRCTDTVLVSSSNLLWL